MRGEVNKFYLGVLNDGKEMEQINVTNIVLIPKVPQPRSIVNFRHISLCNVIYKLIGKATVNRFQKVLELCIDKP